MHLQNTQTPQQQAAALLQQQANVLAAYAYLLTVNQFVDKHRAFTIGGLRSQIFNAEKNGLQKSGALIRNGRRVLINELLYFQWLEAHNSQEGQS